jgi:hypothetical protein
MSIRVCAANTVFLGTLQFNGSPKVPWSLRSENIYFPVTYLDIPLLDKLMLKLLLCRYEGERSVEALAEFINTEAGRL